MEKKESTAFGIPVEIIIFLLVLIASVAALNWFLIKQPVTQEIKVLESKIVVTPVVTASPSATLAPTQEPTATPTVFKSFKRVVAPTVAE